MKRLALPLLALALCGLASLANAEDPPAAAAAPKFNHATHAKLKAGGATECSLCHASSKDGALVKPGADGHKPCMTSGCHLNKGKLGFLEKNPTICLGCHKSSDNHRANEASRVFQENPAPEHYFEFDHALHMKQMGPDGDEKNLCTNCHAIDKKTLSANLHPGHPECMQCHKEGSNPTTMSDCADCHPAGDPKTVFTEHRKDAHIKKGAFSHDHVGHRFMDKEARQQPLQCGSCHYAVKTRANLKDLYAKPIIDTKSMNDYCAKCHDVKDTNKCLECHTEAIKKESFGFIHGM